MKEEKGTMGEYGKRRISEKMSEVIVPSSNMDTPGFLVEMGLSMDDPIHCQDCGWDGNGFMLAHNKTCPVCGKKKFGRGSFK